LDGNLDFLHIILGGKLLLWVGAVNYHVEIEPRRCALSPVGLQKNLKLDLKSENTHQPQFPFGLILLLE